MRGMTPALLLGIGLLAGCGSTYGGLPVPIPGGPSGDVIVVDDERDERGGVYGARTLGVPEGHYPPPGRVPPLVPGPISRTSAAARQVRPLGGARTVRRLRALQRQRVGYPIRLAGARAS